MVIAVNIKHYCSWYNMNDINYDNFGQIFYDNELKIHEEYAGSSKFIMRENNVPRN